MDVYRRSGLAAGILLIVATGAGVAALSAQSALGASDYLGAIAANEGKTLFSALMVLVMGAAGAGVGIALYPALRRHGEAMALGAAGFRIMEGVFHALGAVLLLILVGLSRGYAGFAVAEASQLRGIGAMLLEGRQWSISVAGFFFWGIGAFLYYALFFKTRLVPRWLSLWGLAGIILAFAACLLLLFRVVSDMDTLHTLLNMPVALQEMVLALWLIVKGLDAQAAKATAPSD